jgi:LacI family transcriptional regulator
MVTGMSFSSKDVAKLAGVSQTTVSRVLNGSHNVKKETVLKVMRVMKELNFRPNQIARSLVINKTNTIALISGHLQNPYFVDTTTNIVDIASKHGFNMLVYFENQGDNMSIYQTVLGHKVDGIILSSIFIDDPVYYELEQSGIPFVMFNRKHRAGGNFVEIDNYQATKMATDHLVSLGHTRIGYIGGQTNTSTFLARQNGYIDSLRGHGLSVDLNLLKVTDTTDAKVSNATKELMSIVHNGPTAILAGTDSMALFCMNELHELGVSVPEQVNICGIDNIDISSYPTIQLTTVGNVLDQSMGKIAIKRLIDMIEDKESLDHPLQMTIEPKLIIRKTTSRQN